MPESAWDKATHRPIMSSQVQPTNRPPACARRREERCEIYCVSCCINIICFVVLCVFAIFHSAQTPTPPSTHTQNVAQNMSVAAIPRLRLAPPAFPFPIVYTFMTLSVKSLSSPLISLSPSLLLCVTRATLAATETQLPRQLPSVAV
jgi:hypothetical protein